jgi:4-hydroxyphenylpyruvate dioxygenase
MPELEPFGLQRLEAAHFFVRDLERARRFLIERLDFAELGRCDDQRERESRQRTVALEAGRARLLLSQPAGEGGASQRWLRAHTEGVGELQFEVADAGRALAILESRGATPLTSVERTDERSGGIASFAIATPFGDCAFRFVERLPGAPTGTPPCAGFAPWPAPRGGQNGLGVRAIDHVTSNFLTMKPALLWMEQVLGLRESWRVTFHTSDVDGRHDRGSGLSSVVMSHRGAGVKLANNEPLRPHFHDSQISRFHDDLRGDGVQHLALSVTDLRAAVRELRRRGLAPLPPPDRYYDLLPARLERLGISIREEVGELRELGILVDGERPGEYLLQVFLEDAATREADGGAGPFFFELIERRGSEGFGAGNFRALFECIERGQERQGRA